MAAVALPATGRPVDIEITTRAHAILSASSAERWLVCTPSARIEEALPDRGSSYATDGTAAHAFAELRLRYLLGQSTKAEYVAAYIGTKTLHASVIEPWDHEDWDAITRYVDYVLERKEALGGDDCQVIIEARVDYSKYAEDGFGTSDALLVSGNLGVVEAIDLKFGKGVPVSALGNPQAKLYTLGGFLNLPRATQQKITNFQWAIVQPRLDYTGTDECSADEMRDWAENVVRPQAELAWKGEGKLVPSEKGCRFCKAAPTCRARAAENVLIARRDFTRFMDKKTGEFTPDLGETQMTMEEVAKILPNLDAWMKWARDVQDYATTQAAKGESIPGYKMVRGRANRRWADEEGTIATKLMAQPDVVEDEVYEELPTVRPVRSVAQMEKKMGKSKFTGLANALKLVTVPLGNPVLVPDADPRTAMDAAADARKAFGIEK